VLHEVEDADGKSGEEPQGKERKLITALKPPGGLLLILREEILQQGVRVRDLWQQARQETFSLWVA
jgi:hypothetical protein